MAKLYYESQKDSIKIIKKIIGENSIDCDFKKTPSITFTTSKNDLSKFKKEKEILRKIGVKYCDSTMMTKEENVKDFIMVKNTYTFNPVKYISALLEILSKKNNLRIYEKSRATKIKKEGKKYIVYVNDYKIQTEKIVISCHYPFFTFPGLIPAKTYMEKSYICAAKTSEMKNYALISTNNPIISLRYYNDDKENYCIYLSEVSKISNKFNYFKNYSKNILDAKKYIKKEPEYSWVNIDIMTNDYLPLVGRISESEKNVFIATGYNTWGMTNGTIAGKIISNLILGRKNKYLNLFSPARNFNFKKSVNFLKNTLLSNIKSYGFTLIRKNPSWYKNNTYIVKKDGKRLGIYIDSNGKKHIVLNTCPHLKCHLLFNQVDKTWDCPCHCSRFDIDGNIVNGPSVYNIKYK